MLLEFKCSNHRSIKDEVVFSMLAGSDDSNEESLKIYGKYRVLRSAVIYGANGSGKSNFLDALLYMSSLVRNSLDRQPGSPVPQAAHKSSASDKPSSYSIQFVKNDLRYAYSFSVRQNMINEEYLYYFPNGRQTKIFERSDNEVYPGDKYKKAFNTSMDVFKENRLFLSCAANYSKVKEVEEAFKFFYNDLVIYDPADNNWAEYSLKAMQENDDLKKIFIKIMNALGADIKDVKTRVNKINLGALAQEADLPESVIRMLGTGEREIVDAKVVYDNFEIELSQESSGIRHLFEILCPMIDILVNGKVLVCDELDSDLHESVAFQLVELFRDFKNENFAQLIFTTHDTSLLSSDLFRRDQVWFTEMDSERSTDLYSLVEIKNVRKTENLAKGYVTGKYGAIPIISGNIYQILQSDKS